MKMMDKIRNFLNRKFNPNYKINKALENYLKDYYANSLYFEFKNIEFSKSGFSMALGYKTEPLNSPIPTKSFSDYLDKDYKSYIISYLNIQSKIKRTMKKLENRLERIFTPNNNFHGGLNTKWAI
jgi:hypothetical protein